jgi:hypothetical protein
VTFVTQSRVKAYNKREEKPLKLKRTSKPYEMLQNLYCLMCLIATAFLSSLNAFSNDRGTVRYRTNGHMTMLKDDQMKPKVITPNDIASLFGSSSSSEASDDISYEDDDEDEDEVSASINEVEIVKEEIIPQKKIVTKKRSYDSESVAMNELLALQKEYSTPPPAPIVAVSSSETFREVVHTFYFHKFNGTL